MNPVGHSARSSADNRHHYWRFAAIGCGLLVVGFAVITARLFVWPQLDPLPNHAAAIVELGGKRGRDRDRVALELAREGRAPVVIQSTVVGDTHCLPPVPHVRIECFHSVPSTTRGEARFIAAIAAKRHWRSIILVTTPDQAWRANLRFSRCFSGPIYNATAHLQWHDWFRQIPYQWAASIKALTYERTC